MADTAYSERSHWEATVSRVYTDSDEHALLRSASRDFLARYYPPDMLRATTDEGQQLPAGVWRSLCALGWTGLLGTDSPAELSSVAALAIVAEEAGRALFPWPIAETNIAAFLLAGSTDPAHASRLAAIADGSITVSWCLAGGAGSWSPPLGTGMTLERTGAGYVLTGRATFVDGADSASALLVTVPHGDSLATAWIEPGSGQVRLRPQRTLDVSRRFSAIEISRLELPAGAVVISADGPPASALGVLQLAQLMVAADATGGCAAVVDRAVRYSQERMTFGRVIGSYQAIKHKLADMLVALETARVSVQHAVRCVAEQSPAAAARAVSVAKGHACEAYSRVASESLQIHGGIGFAWEHDCHLFIRRARTDEVLYGTPAWHFRQLAAGG